MSLKNYDAVERVETFMLGESESRCHVVLFVTPWTLSFNSDPVICKL